MRAIIFGANGQDGHYMTQLLEIKNIHVTCISRTATGNIIEGDVTNMSFIADVVKSIQPDYIFNFAANSSTRHELLFENHQTIATGALNILESVLKYSSHTKVFLCGSGLQFVNRGHPIIETEPFEARDSYSIARIQSVYAARYFRTLGLDVYVGYLFNHDSPLRSVKHINQKIAKTVHEIAKGNLNELILGDPSAMKEFTFAGDVVEAIWILVNNKENIRESVIGSGIAYPVQKWVEYCFSYYGLDWRKYLKVSNQFTSDYSVLVCNPKTIKSLGWEPRVNFEQLGEMFCKSNATI